ncbi:hypothetical protein [Chromobacterium violaceum]|uniref:hypothetical protein n=1 Tax=Chromobacterium violaceum TaxID=536 RepID=UPI00194F79A7|nr:hypothetical protein [Chromobacterium violaceum]MBX9267184.1 hypothetical protein [Chromobacterium violaceum]QRO33946.1 hypothetical protein I6K04_04175 [Chromobacterium violaceum]QRQ16250.1 hypothetical protein I6K03_18555 [Chromobacterium violaceum]
MADDWAGLSAQLGKMQQAWYVAARSYWSVFDEVSDTATIIAEDGSTKQIPSWRGMLNALSAAVSTGTTQTITAEKTLTAQLISALPGDTWTFWNTVRKSAIQLNCPDDSKAYLLWRASKPGRRHMAAMDIHSGGSETGVVHVSLHIDGQINTHLWRGADYLAKGSITAGGVVSVGYFTSATLPSASSCPGGIAFVTDAPGGATHAFSNGQKWRIPTMTDL